MSQTIAVGIDLGMSCSAVARIDDVGRSAVVRNPQGDLLIPSIVFFEDDELVFGSAARQAAAIAPNRTAECVKRDLGQAVYSRAIEGRLLPTPLVEACLLKKLVSDLPAGAAKPAVVLAIPSCFHQAQRVARRQAAEIAGIDLLGLIDEPLAAALAFAESSGYLRDGSDKAGCRVLVFDLGGGKLDVAIVEIKPHGLRTLAVGGDSRLGGREWDLRLADYLAAQYEAQFGDDPRHDMASVRRLLQTAEETKHTLSARQQARVHVEREGRRSAELTVPRSALEDVSAPLVLRCQAVAQEVLDRAGLAWRDLAHLLLVGGATRMPMIGKMLEGLTGLKPALSVHPDEAVARGAALVAEQLLAKRQGREAKMPFQINHVTPHSLGIEWLNQSAGRSENVVLISRGTELPCSTTSIATTEVDDQPELKVGLLEGESRDADACSRIAEVVVTGMNKVLPQGSRIDVQYGYSVDGLLQVQARMTKSAQALSAEIKPENALPPAEVAAWRARLREPVGLRAIHAHLPAQEPPASPRPASARAAAPPRRAPAADHQAIIDAPPDDDHDGPPTAYDEPEEIYDDAPQEAYDEGPHSALHSQPPPLNQVRRQSVEDLPPAQRKRQKPRTLRFHLINLTGFAVFSALGLAIGYYMIVAVRPDWNALHLRLPGLRQESPPGGVSNGTAGSVQPESSPQKD